MIFKFPLLFLLISFNHFSIANELGQLSPNQLIKLQKQQNALLIDIRTEKEWAATGIIPNSHKLQFFSSNGKFDAKKWLADLDQLKTSDEQAVILICRSGSRSGMVGDMLIKKGMKNVNHALDEKTVNRRITSIIPIGTGISFKSLVFIF